MAIPVLAIPDARTVVAGPMANSTAEIERRTLAGRIGWAGPLVMIFGRTVLSVLAQAVMASIFWLQGQAAPWSAAAAWWTVWGTWVDLGCLAALFWLVRREGLRLTDLFSFDRRRLWQDVLLGLAYIVVMFPIMMVGGTMLSSWLVFGTTQAPMFTGELTGRVLPAWGVGYSLLLWWVVWSPTEELTYNGYALPRLAALTRSPWLPILLVSLLRAAQHAAVPVIVDGKYFLWRILAFLPLTLTMTAIYLRTRRLVPLVLAHWAMDIIGAVMTLAW